jgi:hypothetical protein
MDIKMEKTKIKWLFPSLVILIIVTVIVFKQYPGTEDSAYNYSVSYTRHDEQQDKEEGVVKSRKLDIGHFVAKLFVRKKSSGNSVVETPRFQDLKNDTTIVVKNVTLKDIQVAEMKSVGTDADSVLVPIKTQYVNREMVASDVMQEAGNEIDNDASLTAETQRKAQSNDLYLPSLVNADNTVHTNYANETYNTISVLLTSTPESKSYKSKLIGASDNNLVALYTSGIEAPSVNPAETKRMNALGGGSQDGFNGGGGADNSNTYNDNSTVVGSLPIGDGNFFMGFLLAIFVVFKIRRFKVA